MFSFEQRKLIAQLERDMKELGLAVSYEDFLKNGWIEIGLPYKYLKCGVDPLNDIMIHLDDYFVSVNMKSQKFPAVKALTIVNQFIKKFSQAEMEATA